MKQDKSILPQWQAMTFEVTVTGAMRDEHVEQIERSLLRCDLGRLPCIVSQVEYAEAVAPELGTPGWDTDDGEMADDSPDETPATDKAKYLHQGIFSDGAYERTLCGRSVTPNHATTKDCDVTCLKCISWRVG